METEHPKTMKLKYVGPPKKGGKVVDLPIPFISKCEGRGQVICNPIGEFEWDDGVALLAIAPEIFVKTDGADSERQQKEPAITVQNDPCQCGCGKPVSKQGNRFILGHSSKFPKKPSQPKSEPAVGIPA